jgi:hypothetical protein
MALLELSLALLFIVLIILIISAIPLNLAVNLLGGESSIIKVIVVNLIVVVAYFIIQSLFGEYAGYAVFAATIIVYMIAFRLGIIRAVIAWLLQGVIAVLLVLAALALGISLL